MKIITDLNFQLKNTAVCIGKFDGLHCGHRSLFSEAKRSGLALVMLTFSFPGVPGIYSEEEKKYLAEQAGMDIMIMIPATEEFLHMKPEDFTRDILAGRCDAKKVVVGEDFCFGYQRSGDTGFLQREGKELGFEVCVKEKLRQDGEVISSTGIRKLLSEGEMGQVARRLSMPYFIQGVVETGNQIGRKMSVPTANIYPAENKVLPPAGVYAVSVRKGEKEYAGIANLGRKPTIPGENPMGLEVWLFDYEGDLYGSQLTVFLLAFLRPEKKFPSMEELYQQIEKDVREAKEILSQPDAGYLR
ncbi:MAG: bifunctional riboflavin kinase/FAD synthetase [Lachnospiraceae bacterium]|nr:bifunctional riboflavin kinase/FAD synthetase [Lachnospiraceae bacterium]